MCRFKTNDVILQMKGSANLRQALGIFVLAVALSVIYGCHGTICVNFLDGGSEPRHVRLSDVMNS